MSRSVILKTALCLVTVGTLISATPMQAKERFVLLIDGSGSMWGQVEGQAKIAILRDALDTVLGQLDTESEVGIVAFGHREKGNCADIEEIVPPTPFDAGLIRSAIANIQPKGKTPLSDGVRFAAQSQRFTEDKATVVILGDGRESCDKDPCAVAEELESLGVDLTVHAIAFDIADEEGSRQLQCFAEKTGGMFLPAADSADLVAALETVREEVAPDPEPEPAAIDMTFLPVGAKTGAALDQAVDWTIINRTNGGEIKQSAAKGPLELALVPGDYTVKASAGGMVNDLQFSVNSSSASTLKVPVALPEPTRVTLTAVDAKTGEDVPGELNWTLVNSATEEILDITGGPGSIHDMPSGDYEVYVQIGDALGEARVTVQKGQTTEVVVMVAIESASPLTANGDSFSAGSEVEIEWNFKGRASDLIFIAPDTQKENSYPLDDWRRHVVGTTSAATLTAPPKPGRYEIRYFSKDAGGLVHRLPIDVTPSEGSLSGPQSAIAGERVQIEWTGPAVSGDFIFIAPVGWNANQYPLGDDGRARVERGSPISLRVPESTGPHEYRYFSAGGGQALFSAPVEVVLHDAFVTGPGSVAAGSQFSIEFQGPRAKGDRIFISKPSMAKNRYTLGSAATNAVSGGSPAKLVAPTQPGAYEIRYFSTEKGGLLASAQLTVTEAGVVLETPRVVIRATDFSVRVKGPYAPGDFVFVATGGMKDNSYPGSKKQRLVPGPGGGGFLDDDGFYQFNSIAPAKPGRYEVRYYSKANGDVLARRALIVK